MNFGRDPLTLSRQTIDKGFGEGALQGPRRVVCTDDGMSQMRTYDATSYVDKALMPPAFRHSLVTDGTTQMGGTCRAIHQRALSRKGISAGSPRGWPKLVPWYANESRGGLNRKRMMIRRRRRKRQKGGTNVGEAFKQTGKNFLKFVNDVF